MANPYNDIQTASPTRGESVEIAGSAGALNADLLPQTDVSNYETGYAEAVVRDEQRLALQEQD